MARTRTIKPGFFRSESLAECSLAARITFAGLWTEADDEGRGYATPRLLATSLWPWDNPTDAEVAGWLRELSNTGHIVLYQHRGKTLFQVVNFDEHQAAAYRRGGSTLPAPPDEPPPDGSMHTSAPAEVQKSARTEQNRTDEKGDEQNRTDAESEISDDDEDVDNLDPVSQSVALYADWVYASDPSACRTVPHRYRLGIANRAMEAHGKELRRHLKRHPEATGADLAAAVLNVPGIGSPPPRSRPPEPMYYFDPACTEHGDDGLANFAPEGAPAEYGPCRCRSGAPYPQPMADVIELRPA
jgi:hypothetical protein